MLSQAMEVLLMRKSLFRSAGRLRFFWVALSCATIATLLLVACGEGGTTPGPTATSQPTTPSQPTATAPASAAKVQIIEQNGKYSFSPATLVITKGTTVAWSDKSYDANILSLDYNSF